MEGKNFMTTTQKRSVWELGSKKAKAKVKAAPTTTWEEDAAAADQHN